MTPLSNRNLQVWLVYKVVEGQELLRDVYASWEAVVAYHPSAGAQPNQFHPATLVVHRWTSSWIDDDALHHYIARNHEVRQ
jgi:hypothetical protein